MDLKLLPPREAAEKLGISPATISRCVAMGAPVHRWGSSGRRYLIDVAEFGAWMAARRRKPQQHRNRMSNADVLSDRRRGDDDLMKKGPCGAATPTEAGT